MPIKQKCPVHNKAYGVPDAGAGKKVRCPFCQMIYLVGTVESHPQPTLPTATLLPPRPAPVPRSRRHALVGAVAAVGVLMGAFGLWSLGSMLGLFGADRGGQIVQVDGKKKAADQPRALEEKADKKPAALAVVDPPKEEQPPKKDAEAKTMPPIAKDLRLPAPPEDSDTLLARLQIAPLDRLADGVKTMTGWLNQPEKFEGLRQAMTAGLPPGLAAALDTTRPLGAYLQIRPAGIRPVILLPVRDRAKLLQAVNLPDKTPDGNWLIALPALGQPMNLRFAHEHAYLTFGKDHPTSDAELLKPAQVFAPQGDALISAVCRIDRLLPEKRGKSLAELMEAMAPVRKTLLAGMTKAQADFANQCFDSLLQLQSDFVAGARAVAISVESSAATGQLTVQLQLDVAPDSDLARSIRSIGSMPSLFGSLADVDAAFRFCCHVKMSDKLHKPWVPLAREITDLVLKNESDSETLKEGKRVFQALQPAIDAAELDLAFLLIADPTGGSFLGAAKAPSSRKLEALVQQKVSELPDAKDRELYRWNADVIDGVNVHRLGVSKLLPATMRSVFGRHDFHLAARDDAVMWAGGSDSLLLMGKGIRAKPRGSPPLLLEFNVSRLAPLLPLAEAGKEKAAARKHLTERNPGRVRMSLEGGDSLRLRFSVDHSLIGLVGEFVSIAAPTKKPS